MAKKRQPYYDWNKEEGIATCVLFDGRNPFIGIAKCHPDDADFQSEKTGMIIAESRAEIKALQHYKNNILQPGLDALNQLYHSINKSKNYNKKSYEAKMLYRQIRMKEKDIELIKEVLKQRKQYLKEFIDDKDAFYKSVKKNRDKIK